MEDGNLLSNGLVRPFAIQMEPLDEHESSHSPIQLLILHALEYVRSEVRMVERPILDLSCQDDEDEA